MTANSRPARRPIAVAKLPTKPSQLATRAEGIATAVDEDKVNFPTTVPEATQTHTLSKYVPRLSAETVIYGIVRDHIETLIGETSPRWGRHGRWACRRSGPLSVPR
jgi:hypothetical protein